jgi:hypothetical protein
MGASPFCLVFVWTKNQLKEKRPFFYTDVKNSHKKYSTAKFSET